MITLTLLHPIQSTPVQSWPFEHESVIRIGRSSDNHVILYSAVVSRHHVELRQNGSKWEIVNMGANGTYLNGKQITQVDVVNGVVIRLARSGPSIQIQLGIAASGANGESTLGERARPKAPDATLSEVPLVAALTTPLPPTAAPPTQINPPPPKPEAQDDTIGEKRKLQTKALESLFDIHTGNPLQVLHTIRDYQVVKNLSQDGTGLDQIVWRGGQSLLMRSLNPTWKSHPAAREQFRQQADRLTNLRHPGLPQFFEFFELEGQPYLVREWLHGQSLSQRVETQGKLPPDQAIGAVLQVCAVLDYLHQQSPPLLHQNLNPDNLIQRIVSEGKEGKLGVTGFLSLNTLAADVQPPAVSFNAPEQQQGLAFPTSDLFALGTLLVYLLTGKPPKLFYAQRDQGLRFHPEDSPGLAPKLVSIVQKLTNPRPEERYATAQAVAAALRQV